jgi:small subunit ribosomal protein S6
MAKYETMFIVKPDLKEDEKEALFKQLQDTIIKNGGQIINQQVWLAKSHLTFAIKKQKEGTYYLIQFSIDTSAISQLRQPYGLNESVLRFMITKIGSK